MEYRSFTDYIEYISESDEKIIDHVFIIFSDINIVIDMFNCFN